MIHVESATSVTEALAIAPYVSALLLDSGSPNAGTPALGGTGRTHNWELSRQIVQGSPVPVYLAGGLNAENVATAIEQVRPFGVDICSGVRSNDRLDERKLSAFVAAVQGVQNARA